MGGNKNNLINNDSDYNDIPDYSGSCPDCPTCGTAMRYSYSKSKFKCPDCGMILNEDDWHYESDDVPWGCQQCNGPYPDCKTCCKLFDD